MFDSHDEAQFSSDRGECGPAAWAPLRDWLTYALSGARVGGALNLGPVRHGLGPVRDGLGPVRDGLGRVRDGHENPAQADDDVPCAQILVLTDRTLMVRLSTTMMAVPAVFGYSVPRAMLDRWNYEDRFRDCTDGYLVSRSWECVADICVAWFRDRRGFTTPADVGFTYTTRNDIHHGL